MTVLEYNIVFKTLYRRAVRVCVGGCGPNRRRPPATLLFERAPPTAGVLCKLRFHFIRLPTVAVACRPALRVIAF